MATDDATGRTLEIGAFYWVIPVLDPDTDEEWEHGEQPARYAGAGKWNCLNIDGANDWPMRYVGPRIATPPGEG